MAFSMTRQKRYLAAFQLAQNKRVGGIAERGFYTYFMLIGEAGHGVKSTAADDADFSLSQTLLLTRA